MNELYNEVKNALDGVVIPPLQNIINEFLPNRAILTSYGLLDWVNIYNPTMCVSHWNGRPFLVCFNGSTPATLSVPITEDFILNFSKFLPRSQRTGYFPQSAVVICQGETEVIEIH